MRQWLHDVVQAVVTVAHGMYVTLRYWLSTYKNERGTFTEKFEYPETPVGKERVAGGKGFVVTGFTIDYTKCMFCALCVEPCPVDCIFMGATHDLSCYSRDGCMVDFARLPVDVAWGRASLNPTAVAESKVIVEPVHGGPNQ